MKEPSEKEKKGGGLTSIGSSLNRAVTALLSGHQAAYQAMAIKLVGPLFRLVDRLIARSTKRPSSPLPKCIMVVSCPRSGSTIAYQFLAQVLRCAYITNLHALLPRTGSALLRKFDLFGKFRKRSRSYYGYTEGLSNVYEGNELFERIFVDDDIDAIRSRFYDFCNDISPVDHDIFVFKNVRYFEKLALLHQAVPEVFFVKVNRSISAIIQSEYIAAQALGGIHPVPSTLNVSEYDDLLDLVCHQIEEMQTILDSQRSEIGDASWLELHYEQFCEDPEATLEAVCGKTGIAKSLVDESQARLFELSCRNNQKVNDAELARISEYIAKQGYDEIEGTR